MHGIILAAGRGKRLDELKPAGRPKCLLTLGGRSLLARQLDLLHANGIRQVDLVVGYEADRIIEHVGTLHSRPDVAFFFNPGYEQGSVISLLTARETLESGQDILLMDADVLCHPDVISRLVQSNHRNCFLVDREFEMGEEPVKIAVRDGRIVDFRKCLDPQLSFDYLGESVGFFRFSAEFAAKIALECARFESEGLADSPHEEILRQLVRDQPGAFGLEDVTGLPWIEIDFPEDVVRAREVVLPAIRADWPGY